MGSRSVESAEAFVSGVKVTPAGEKIVPATQRPDGTWRKERKVREGYVAPEDVKIYEARPKTRGPVGMATGMITPAATSATQASAKASGFASARNRNIPGLPPGMKPAGSVSASNSAGAAPAHIDSVPTIARNTKRSDSTATAVQSAEEVVTRIDPNAVEHLEGFEFLRISDTKDKP